MSEEEDSKWRRRFERERAARKEAELLLEDKSRDLYQANRSLESHARELETLVSERTSRLAANQADLVSFNRMLIKLGLDTEQNLDSLVQTCGKILRADLVIYSRRDKNGRLPIRNHWSGGEVDLPQYCPICEVVYHAPQNELLILNDLNRMADPEEMDGRDMPFATYAGYPVGRAADRIGVIGVFFMKPGKLDPFRKQVIEMIATAVGMEEDRALTRRKLEMQERRFAAVFEGSIDGILLHDENGQIIESNFQASRLLGFSRDQLRQMTLRDLHPEKWFDLCGEALDKVRENGAFRFEAEFQRSDNSVFLAEISASQFEVGDERYIQSIIRDITEKRRLDNERRQAAADLARAKAEAERANAAKSLFLANMSHEIRTPMNGIIGFTEILAETELNDRQSGYLKTIRSSGEMLLSIINDILDLSRIEEGRLEMNPSQFDPARCIREIAGILETRASDKGLSIRIEIAEEAPELIEADRDRLCQVLLNLINNAIKFTSKGEIVVRLRLETKAGSKTPRAVFEVEDSGVGISEEDQETLFVPFNQVGELSARREGTGLGLAICRSLVEAMGGTISCESELGRGSCFRFDLPEGLRKREAVIHTVGVLLANPIQSRLLQALLAQQGHHTSAPTSAEEVLEQYEKGVIDVVISDLDGWERIEKRLTESDDSTDITGILAVPEDAFDAASVPADWRKRGVRRVLAFPVDPKKLSGVMAEIA